MSLSPTTTTNSSSSHYPSNPPMSNTNTNPNPSSSSGTTLLSLPPEVLLLTALHLYSPLHLTSQDRTTWSIFSTVDMDPPREQGLQDLIHLAETCRDVRREVRGLLFRCVRVHSLEEAREIIKNRPRVSSSTRLGSGSDRSGFGRSKAGSGSGSKDDTLFGPWGGFVRSVIIDMLMFEAPSTSSNSMDITSSDGALMEGSISDESGVGYRNPSLNRKKPSIPSPRRKPTSLRSPTHESSFLTHLLTSLPSLQHLSLFADASDDTTLSLTFSSPSLNYLPTQLRSLGWRQRASPPKGFREFMGGGTFGSLLGLLRRCRKLGFLVVDADLMENTRMAGNGTEGSDYESDGNGIGLGRNGGRRSNNGSFSQGSRPLRLTSIQDGPTNASTTRDRDRDRDRENDKEEGMVQEDVWDVLDALEDRKTFRDPYSQSESREHHSRSLKRKGRHFHKLRSRTRDPLPRQQRQPQPQSQYQYRQMALPSPPLVSPSTPGFGISLTDSSVSPEREMLSTTTRLTKVETRHSGSSIDTSLNPGQQIIRTTSFGRNPPPPLDLHTGVGDDKDQDDQDEEEEEEEDRMDDPEEYEQSTSLVSLMICGPITGWAPSEEAIRWAMKHRDELRGPVRTHASTAWSDERARHQSGGRVVEDMSMDIDHGDGDGDVWGRRESRDGRISSPELTDYHTVSQPPILPPTMISSSSSSNSIPTTSTSAVDYGSTASPGASYRTIPFHITSGSYSMSSQTYNPGFPTFSLPPPPNFHYPPSNQSPYSMRNFHNLPLPSPPAQNLTTSSPSQQQQGTGSGQQEEEDKPRPRVFLDGVVERFTGLKELFVDRPVRVRKGNGEEALTLLSVALQPLASLPHLTLLQIGGYPLSITAQQEATDLVVGFCKKLIIVGWLGLEGETNWYGVWRDSGRRSDSKVDGKDKGKGRESHAVWDAYGVARGQDDQGWPWETRAGGVGVGVQSHAELVGYKVKPLEDGDWEMLESEMRDWDRANAEPTPADQAPPTHNLAPTSPPLASNIFQQASSSQPSLSSLLNDQPSRSDSWTRLPHGQFSSPLSDGYNQYPDRPPGVQRWTSTESTTSRFEKLGY